jgi:hypothetical protein
MGKYISISGSILCTEEQARVGKSYIEGLTVQDIGIEISQEQFELYMTGWFFPMNQMNWMSYIFYGGSIRESSTELIKIVLQKLIRRIQEECTADDHNVEGYFWLISEEGNQVFWKIDSGVIEINPC